jgi:hypothetical protein
MSSNLTSQIDQVKIKSKPPPPPPKPKALSSRTTSTDTPEGQATARKRGLGWPWDYQPSHFALYQPHVESGKVSWLFNWELWIPGCLPANIEWIPCVRIAANAKDIDPFLTDIIQNRGVKTSALLGFNEPEIPDQANLSVEQAVDLWRQVVLPAKTKFNLRLGSPGMSSDVSRSKPWLSSFLAQLNGQDGVDFLVLHWYGPHFGDMRGFLEDMHATYDLPVWLNEFACSHMGAGEASPDEVEQFLREALPWLDACPWIERYAYFGNAQGQDVGTWVGRGNNFSEQTGSSDGRNLTSMGRLYCSS